MNAAARGVADGVTLVWHFCASETNYQLRITNADLTGRRKGEKDMCMRPLRTKLRSKLRSFGVRRAGVVLGFLIGTPGALGAIYSNDFEGTVGPEWSNSGVTTAPGQCHS